jgi:hypothetical protein
MLDTMVFARETACAVLGMYLCHSGECSTIINSGHCWPRLGEKGRDKSRGQSAKHTLLGMHHSGCLAVARATPFWATLVWYSGIWPSFWPPFYSLK